MNEINRKPAYNVAELASTRKHQKTGRPSWSARWRVGHSSETINKYTMPPKKITAASAYETAPRAAAFSAARVFFGLLPPGPVCDGCALPPLSSLCANPDREAEKQTKN